MKICLIDDSSTYLLHMQTILQKMQNVEIVTYKDPLKAMDEIHNINPNIIVTDFEMPGINGDELCRQLRSQQQFLTTPILMLTSKDGDEAYLKAITSGADDYLCKSSNEKVFTVKILTMIRKVAWMDKDAQTKQLEAIHSLITLTNHEFNNALMAAMGYLKRIRKHHPEFEERSMDKIDEALNRIKDINHQLMSIEKIELEDYTPGKKMLKL